MKKSEVKFALIGAGSMSFAPVTIIDILMNENFKTARSRRFNGFFNLLTL